MVQYPIGYYNPLSFLSAYQHTILFLPELPWNQAGPCWAYRHKSFCVPHFFYFFFFSFSFLFFFFFYRISFSLHNLSWIPKGRLLIREREGMQRQRRNSQETIMQCRLGQGSGSSSRNIHNNIFEFFCRIKTLNKWKQMEDPRTSPGANRHQHWRRMKACIYPYPYLWPYFLLPNYKTTSYSFPREGTVFRSLACCGLLCLAKQ